MPQREPGGSKAQGSISEINLKERSAECSGLSGLNRSNAPSHSKKLRKRQLIKRIFTFEIFLSKNPGEQDGPDRERRVVLRCTCCPYGCCQDRFLRQS